MLSSALGLTALSYSPGITGGKSSRGLEAEAPSPYGTSQRMAGGRQIYRRSVIGRPPLGETSALAEVAGDQMFTAYIDLQ